MSLCTWDIDFKYCKRVVLSNAMSRSLGCSKLLDTHNFLPHVSPALCPCTFSASAIGEMWDESFSVTPSPQSRCEHFVPSLTRGEHCRISSATGSWQVIICSIEEITQRPFSKSLMNQNCQPTFKCCPSSGAKHWTEFDFSCGSHLFVSNFSCACLVSRCPDKNISERIIWH